MKRIGDLQLEQDLAFERRSWRVQRIVQVLLGLFVVAAAAGFFGSGPAARATAGDPAGELAVEYPRFARRNGPAEMVLQVRPRAGVQEVEVWAGQSFTESYHWETATPEPTQMSLRDGRVWLKFAVASGDAPARIVFHLKPQQLGSVATRIGLAGGPEVSLHAFHFP